MMQGDILLKAIKADPADDLARLAYADWCEEDGQWHRAEFIRAQVELSRVESACGSESGDYLCRSLRCKMCPQIRRQNSAWLDMPVTKDYIPPPGLAVTIFAGPDHAPPVVHVRRGFIQSVQCPHDMWLQHGEAIVKANPVEWVTLTDRRPLAAHGLFGWWAEKTYRDDEDIDCRIWDNLKCGVEVSRWRGYRSRDEANDALSAACVRMFEEGP